MSATEPTPLRPAPLCPECSRMLITYGAACRHCESLTTPWGQAVYVLWDALTERGLTEVACEPHQPWCRHEVARVELCEGGLLRQLASRALSSESAPPRESVVSIREGRLVLFVRGPGGSHSEDIGLPGTVQVEEWVDGDPMRTAALEEALAYHVPTGEPWVSETLPDAVAWRAFLAASSVWGGDHPCSLRDEPWPGREGLRALLGRGGWATGELALPIWVGPPELGAYERWAAQYQARAPGAGAGDLVEELEYGGGRSRAQLEFLPDGARVICTAVADYLPTTVYRASPEELPPNRDPEEVADCWRSVRARAHAAIAVIRSSA